MESPVFFVASWVKGTACKGMEGESCGDPVDQTCRGAPERMGEKTGITRKEVETLLMNPEQIVPGDQDALVAQAKRKSGLLRVPFVEREGKRKILMVY